MEQVINQRNAQPASGYTGKPMELYNRLNNKTESKGQYDTIGVNDNEQAYDSAQNGQEAGDTVRMTTINQYPPIVRYDDIVVEAENSPTHMRIVNDYSERVSRRGRDLSPQLD